MDSKIIFDKVLKESSTQFDLMALDKAKFDIIELPVLVTITEKSRTYRKTNIYYGNAFLCENKTKYIKFESGGYIDTPILETVDGEWTQKDVDILQAFSPKPSTAIKIKALNGYITDKELLEKYGNGKRYTNAYYKAYDEKKLIKNIKVMKFKLKVAKQFTKEDLNKWTNEIKELLDIAKNLESPEEELFSSRTEDIKTYGDLYGKIDNIISKLLSSSIKYRDCLDWLQEYQKIDSAVLYGLKDFYSKDNKVYPYLSIHNIISDALAHKVPYSEEALKSLINYDPSCHVPSSYYD
ncbi:MAG: hypothetical protein HUJ68_11710 [Clostridia bacterium]|mgnify:CR=1 FL=1|nr:hypothetical protein [Clostridia bacterium]